MSMRSLILGTAGHIDHGKTALVQALTGVDTDRLKEEKERGITIDLGFAEWVGRSVRLGVVDVPGHEGFIRNMLAGATGMDVVLLVVAADEGVMPQTREHLAIVSLLRADRLLVALTKSDLVEPEWIELVEDDVRSLLGSTPYHDAPIIATSARTGEGLEELRGALDRIAEVVADQDTGDLARMPVDRVFTVHGTGTVLTGTLWSGQLRAGQQVAIRPGPIVARIRKLEVHGRPVEEARAGERTAIALTGQGVERAAFRRGQCVVDLLEWPSSSMLTVRAELLADTGWRIEHNQRVRVHLGTAETLARVVMLEDRSAHGDGLESSRALGAGEAGWLQLRLEEPVLARAGERFVLRSYSPMTTIGGGVVAEPQAPKRRRLSESDLTELGRILQGDDAERLGAAARLAGSTGIPRGLLPIVAGITQLSVDAAVTRYEEVGGRVHGELLISAEAFGEARTRMLSTLLAFHRSEPLRPGAPVDALRAGVPPAALPWADAVIDALREEGELELRRGVAARPDFTPVLTDAQTEVRERLETAYRSAGLAAPSLSELPGKLAQHPDLWPILRMLQDEGALVALEDELFVHAEALDAARRDVLDRFAGRSGLGPADFREVLDLTRKRLLPVLAHFDRTGVTTRRGDTREVSTE